VDHTPHAASTPFTVHTVELSADRVLVVATGELDISTAAQLSEHLMQVVAGGCLHLDVDLTRVPFCDVVGFDLLLDAARSLRARQGTLRIISPCWSLQYMAGTFGVNDLLGLPAVTGAQSRRSAIRSGMPR